MTIDLYRTTGSAIDGLVIYTPKDHDDAAVAVAPGLRPARVRD